MNIKHQRDIEADSYDAAGSPRDFQSYLSKVAPMWCPGCGNPAVLSAFIEAVRTLDLETHDVALISGIGCSSRFPYFVKAYGFHGVHGRALPIAQGVKLARPHLTVVVPGGDGDGLAIGGGHLPHVARNNVDITYLLFNNSIYGLTKGQTSPTTMSLAVTRTSPYGFIGEPMNPTALAIAYQASFVARGFAVRKEHLRDLITEAITHRGFSFVEILTGCPAFDTKHINISRVLKKLAYIESDPADDYEAMKLARDGNKIYLGIFRRVRKPTLEERLKTMERAANQGDTSIESLLKEFG